MPVSTAVGTDRDQVFQNRFRIEDGLSQFLDCARWMSALLVLLTHVSNRVTVRLGGTIEGADSAQIAWGFVCGFGHHAVVVFFVLSGFLVGSKVIRDVATDSFETSRYMLARVSRIHLVLIPALLLTLVLDTAGMHLNAGIYANSEGGSFIGNILLMQGFLTDSFGSDGPLGTLANEFWYYMTFPVLAVGIWKKRIWLVGVAALMLVPATIIQPWHGVGFILWVIGALAGSIEPRAVSRRTQIALLIVFVVLLVALRLGIRLEQYTLPVMAVTDIVVASVFALVLFGFRRNAVFRLGRFSGTNSSFAGFSYSLYAIHAPIIMVLCALSLTLTGFGWRTPVTQPWQWAVVLTIAATSIVAAYFFARCTEANTEAVRAWLDALRLRRWQDWPSSSGETRIIALGEEAKLAPLEPILAETPKEIRLPTDAGLTALPETPQSPPRPLKL